MLSWKTKDGSRILIKDLKNDHLINILRMLKKQATGKWLYASKLLLTFPYPGGDAAQDCFDAVLAEEAEKTWEDYVIEIFHDLKDEAEKRNLEWDMWNGGPAIEKENKIDLSQRGKLEASVVGALRDCIKAHGNITKETAPSAAKRIIGMIKDFNRRVCKS